MPECFLGETFRAFRAAAAVYRKKADEQHKRLTLERGQQEELVAEADRRDALWSEICARHKTDRGYDMQAIANDPDLDQLGRQHARTMMERLGRYSKTGL